MIEDLQIKFIENELNKSKIRNRELRDDLLDHLCCLVEIDMKKGLSFEQAYQKAFLQTSPNGFDEIQNETLFLLNYNKIINMKRLTYITGFIFSAAFTVGILFKLWHLPGANILVYGGMTGGVVIFMPLLLINQYKHLISVVLSERMKWILGLTSLIIFATGSWMKLAHLPGAAVVFGLSFLVFGFGFLPFLFFRMYKKSVEQI